MVRYGTVRYGTVWWRDTSKYSYEYGRRWTLDRYAFQCSSRIGNDTKPPGVMLVARHFGLCSKILETREDRCPRNVRNDGGNGHVTDITVDTTCPRNSYCN